jgi:two-component sensor histidine kinase
MALKDSIINNERDAKLIELETQFNLAETQMDKIRSERKFENLVVWIIISGLIILFIISFLVYKNTNKQKVNRLLVEKNKLNQTLIDQKQLHLSETNHRVKNNLQLIQSLIRMQKRRSPSTDTKSHLTEIQNKIRAISVVHELAIENHQENQNINQYATQISDSIQASAPMPFKIELNCDTTIELSPNQLQTIGLLINEILTNSIKYAHPKNEQTLTSSVKVYRSGATTIIEAFDNGTPSEVQSVSGQGTLLVDGLVQQLNGSYSLELNKGFKYTISFT